MIGLVVWILAFAGLLACPLVAQPAFPNLKTKEVVVSAEVPPMNMTMGFIPVAPLSLGKWAWVKLEGRFVDKNNEDIPPTQLYLHHALIGTWNRSSIMCRGEHGEKLPVARVAGIGADMTGTSLPFPFAYVVDTPEKWMIEYHIVSHVDYSMEANIVLTFSYFEFEAQPPTYTLPVSTIWLDVVDQCNAEFTVPGSAQPSVYMKSRTFKSPFKGRFAAAMGHVHYGGLDFTLQRNNEEICHATPSYRQDGYLASVGFCGDINAPVDIGDILDVSVSYDNTRGELKQSMGIFLSYAYVEELGTLDGKRLHGESKSRSHSSSGTAVLTMGMVAISLLQFCILFVIGLAVVVLYRRWATLGGHRTFDAMTSMDEL